MEDDIGEGRGGWKCKSKEGKNIEKRWRKNVKKRNKVINEIIRRLGKNVNRE